LDWELYLPEEWATDPVRQIEAGPPPRWLTLGVYEPELTPLANVLRAGGLRRATSAEIADRQ